VAKGAFEEAILDQKVLADSSPAIIKAYFPKCSDFSRIESVQGFPPTVKPFPLLDRF
jgi:hypothetical protein